MQYNPKEIEKEILKFWEENKIFEKLVELRKDGPKFSFIDGPITANNPMGVHHAWGRTYKDLFQRFKAMQGYNLRYQNGFDCQGLHVEVGVEKSLGFNSKKDIEKFGLDNFSKKCRESVNKFSKIQTEQSKKLGMWMDWDNSYYTMSDRNIEAIWYFLKKCNEKGWLYKGTKVMPWCIRCGTSLSKHELSDDGYAELTHKSVFIKCKITGKKNDSYFLQSKKGHLFAKSKKSVQPKAEKMFGQSPNNEHLLIWTTTPWTLTSNVAAAVNPDLEYLKIKIKDEIFYLSKGTLKKVLEDCEYEILEKLSGKDLIGLKYDSPYSDLPAQAGVEHKVIPWKSVSEEEGTGIVHIAPGCGEEDYELGKEFGLKKISPLDESGFYSQGFDWLTGKNVKDIPDLIINDLKKRNFLFKTENYTHRYPICWRCKEELVFRLVNEWFISCDEIRGKMKEEAEKVKWKPRHTGKLMQDWLDNMGDWCISRKRYWGMPLPFYECECGNIEIIGSVKELEEKAVNKEDVKNIPELHRPWIDKIKIKCSKCGKEIERIKDIGDCWLDAGIIPFSTLKYFEDRAYWEKWFPVEFICEMRAQTRLWFYSQLFMSVTLEQRTPYLSVLAYESVVDEKGDEMHKSKGNTIWFDEAVEKMGADVMRWIYCSQNPGIGLRFGYTVAKDSYRILNVFYNTVNYLETYYENSETNQTFEPDILDKWLLSRVQSLKNSVTKHIENLEVNLAIKQIQEFILNDLSRLYGKAIREAIKLGVEGKKPAHLNTLYNVTLDTLKILAPFVPFITESLYQNLFRKYENKESIHLYDWPKVEKEKINLKLEKKFELAKEISGAINNERQKHDVRLRLPVKKATVFGSAKIKEVVDEMKEIIKTFSNLKEIKFEKAENVEIKPNFASIGKKFGAKTTEVVKLISKLKVGEIKDKLKLGEFELEKDDLIIRQKSVEGTEFFGGYVTLDLTEDEELKEERFLRELIREIQKARQEEKLNVLDKITLFLEDKEFIKKFGDEIKKEVKAEKIVYGLKEKKGGVKYKDLSLGFWFEKK